MIILPTLGIILINSVIRGEEMFNTTIRNEHDKGSDFFPPRFKAEGRYMFSWRSFIFLCINPGNRIKFLIFQFGLRAGNLEEEDLLHWDPLDPLIVWYLSILINCKINF